MADLPVRVVSAPVFADSGREQAPDEPLTANRLVLLAGLGALGALATNIMLPAFPEMAREFGVLPRDLAWTLSSFFIAFALGQLLVGPLADAFGRAPLVLGGLVVFFAGTLVCVFAPSLPLLIAGRVVQALGACAASVLSRAIARDLYQGPALTRALALVMIAMAVAPGFSPLAGTGLTMAFGWRSTFVLVAAAGVLLAFHYRLSVGETLPLDRRTPARLGTVLRTYRALIVDPRFIAPALAVSLVIGCLYSFFGAAPPILMTGMGMSGAGLSIFFAATVFVVLGSGLMAPRLARRWGAAQVGMAGLSIAVAGALWLLLRIDSSTQAQFMAAVTVFLLGMGMINPIAMAIALQPFGHQAGAASALLGFLQMGCAAIGTALISAMPLDPNAAFAVVCAGGTGLAAAIFVRVVRQSKA